ncbi:AfsR/SARP family transcriptional regulator [Kitasatospora phosalacinea]|uniref:AfsR/SARP family transcriptional regulator n=1 Tax=Kitasatospora phosalacinea TaxID=2065 RepID=UPI002555097A|nr:AfsR/SARP family transcriptional regulator [Kitasatospora phosalacinea]
MPSARKTKQVLALLLLNANHLVSVPTFIEELWDDKPPASAMTTLQTYVFQLRRMIAEAVPGVDPKEILATTLNGYVLHVPPDCLDLNRYEQARTLGLRQYAAGRLHEAAHSLRTALGTWSGPALADVKTGRRLDSEVVRLHESRLTAYETCLDAELATGAHATLISELTGLTSQHPMHEPFHRQLMLALYRASRRPDALSAFQRLRTTLVNELGLEPSREVQMLHQSILSADPALDHDQVLVPR